MLFYCSIDLWVLLMLGDLTSSFFSFSFRYCWCMGTISQKSFSWFCCYFGICHLISRSSSIFSTMVVQQIDGWGFDVQKVFFWVICGSVNAREFNFQAISLVWFCSCIWHILSFVNAFLFFGASINVWGQQIISFMTILVAMWCVEAKANKPFCFIVVMSMSKVCCFWWFYWYCPLQGNWGNMKFIMKNHSYGCSGLLINTR